MIILDINLPGNNVLFLTALAVVVILFLLGKVFKRRN